MTSTIFSVTTNSSGSKYVAVGDSGKIATSANGTTWVQTFPASSFGSSQIRAVATNNETYVAAGTAGKLGTSIDLSQWVQRSAGFDLSNINGLVLGVNASIAVGSAGKIAYSGG